MKLVTTPPGHHADPVGLLIRVLTGEAQHHTLTVLLIQLGSSWNIVADVLHTVFSHCVLYLVISILNLLRLWVSEVSPKKGNGPHLEVVQD